MKYIGLQKLIQRNEQLYSSGNAPNGGVSLPFILVQVCYNVLFFGYFVQWKWFLIFPFWIFDLLDNAYISLVLSLI